MFCNNCGTQLPDNAAFCNNCGAKVGVQPVYSAPVQYSAPAVSSNNGAKGVSSRIFGIVALLAGAISALLICATEAIVYGLKSSGSYDQTFNIFKFLDLGAGTDKVDSAMGCIVAGLVCAGVGVLLLLAAVAGSKAKPGCASGAGVCFIMYVICMVVSVYAILGDGKPSSIKFGYNAVGWIGLVLGIVAVITAFATAAQIKKQKATVVAF